MNQENSEREGIGAVRRASARRTQLHGLYVVDKPKGITSFDVVQRIRGSTGIRQIGHIGTLDPLATGVLPVCVGEATKLVPYLFSGKRRYAGECVLGLETDTEDITGTIVSKSDAANIPTHRIEEILQGLTGVQVQLAPLFSAVKYRGKPSYYWARKGIAVPRKERRIQVEAFDLSRREGDRICFDLLCSSGTYVRSLVGEVGRLLGCGACVTGLRRLQCGCFLVEDAVSLEHLATCLYEDGEGGGFFWPLIKLLPGFESVLVDEEMMQRLGKGMAIPYPEGVLCTLKGAERGAKIKVIYNNTVVALAEPDSVKGETVLRPIRILHTT